MKQVRLSATSLCSSGNRFLDHDHHVPVLLTETLEILNPKSDGLYVDATFGRGGHAGAILRQLGANGRLIVIDRDLMAIEQAKKKFADERRVTALHSGFAQLRQALAAIDIVAEQVDGFVFDLGVSSPQIDDPKRGFSFMQDGPLDMRMDTSSGKTAADWINQTTEEELMQVIARLGEERFAGRVARAVVEHRPFVNTSSLAAVIEKAIPRRTHVRGRHPATKSFQAIRMHVNDELGQLESALPQAFDLLAEGGRLAAISFHSLEDRVVKAFVFKMAKKDDFPLDFPVTAEQQRPRARALGGLKRPSAGEVEANPRSRSGRLRGLEKLEVRDA